MCCFDFFKQEESFTDDEEEDDEEEEEEKDAEEEEDEKKELEELCDKPQNGEATKEKQRGNFTSLIWQFRILQWCNVIFIIAV